MNEQTLPDQIQVIATFSKGSETYRPGLYYVGERPGARCISEEHARAALAEGRAKPGDFN